MLYIAALVHRNKDGDLIPDTIRRRKNRNTEEGLLEVTGPNPGDVVALWEYDGKNELTADEARQWITMTFPDSIYVHSSWGEMIRIQSHYRQQVGES